MPVPKAKVFELVLLKLGVALLPKPELLLPKPDELLFPNPEGFCPTKLAALGLPKPGVEAPKVCGCVLPVNAAADPELADPNAPNPDDEEAPNAELPNAELTVEFPNAGIDVPNAGLDLEFPEVGVDVPKAGVVPPNEV